MKRLVLRIVINTVALFVISLILPVVVLNGIGPALLAGTVLTLLNALLRPFLLLITLPVNLITLGVFTLVINAWMLMLTDLMVGGFAIPGFLSAFVAALLLTLINLPLSNWFRSTYYRAS
ncbi:MAG: phage holin family protein [Eubacteriales bacterium]|nr:phage holin family protein [Bacillota bacterium]MBV1728608.1 phage holin family protein [Desulforudis sp.]MDZ4042807.1 phage holin family protein [Eubacteriales bacterium]MBU4533692.1 phage holin family protein [Bacillota bacterium]MBU4554793.1 phage holin family protein [Bacillota bacterium]